jgi:cyclophilin family peptidyl-prolyl cis-trans isomerase/HEAT repeat protein
MNTDPSHSAASRKTNPAFCLCLSFVVLFVFCQRAEAQAPKSRAALPNNPLVRILRAEDERRWDEGLDALLADRISAVRRRAALAAGRIGNERAVPALITLLQKDSDENVRAMAAFALGEIESASAAEALIAALNLNQREPTEIRARAVEALGKIAAALPESEESRALPIKAAILGVLKFEAGRRSASDTEVILLAVTAALRARPENAGKVIASFLRYSDPRVRAAAANTLARLKLSDGNADLRKLLINDPNPVMRANSARVLGATEDKAAFNALVNRALRDRDLRVRVSAIRALANLKDARAGSPLIKRGDLLLRSMMMNREAFAGLTNEVLEIASALGRLFEGTENKESLSFLRNVRRDLSLIAPEIEIAVARISPAAYLAELGTEGDAKRKAQTMILVNWKAAASLAQGLGAIAALPDSNTNKNSAADQAVQILLAVLDYRNSGININTLVAVHSEYAIPDILRALAAFKPNGLDEVLRNHLKESDVVIRATAAELLGALPADEINARALIQELPQALNDKELNDAALAILEALEKQKSSTANKAIKTALDSTDRLIRRKAVAVLKDNGVGDFRERVGTVQTRNTTADYQRALARIGKQVRATVNTSSGSFVIEFLPGDAPLTVDNFVMLARKGYFNGQTVPRAVPNFVIQTGDPRGDQNGGPGYSIRCEINQATYERGAVGMALSGKDTGGSQWFVTHSPQPHLDGGYTVFGRVIAGMEVVDKIVRGDVIRSITVSENNPRASKPIVPAKAAHSRVGHE